MKSNAVRQASDADFKLLFETIPGQFIILLPDDPAFTVVAVSNAYLKAVNQSRDAIVGKGLFETFPAGPDPSHAKRRFRICALRFVRSLKRESQIAFLWLSNMTYRSCYLIDRA